MRALGVAFRARDDACNLSLQLSPHGLEWGYRQRHDCGVGRDLIVVSVDSDLATPVGRDRGLHRLKRDLPVKGPIETRAVSGFRGQKEQGPTATLPFPAFLALWFV